MNINDLPDPKWYVNTGATAYMSSDPGSILSCSLHKGNEKNFVGGAIVLGISHDGHTVLPSSPLKNCLENVLVVPEIKNFYIH